ncbi:hypothetical protein R3P38DRAFT_3250359 [Favolaschia claudopus]|uniref:F-box domain-containing protein n=1 Tax=Favolaschia claudopus TaxID=2862362 RepID=A0AAW0EHD7_9AGAR
MATTTTELPLEIIELIIDRLSEDRDALETCSLVALNWVRCTRSYLFSTAVLENTHSIPTLAELLESPLSTIVHAIRYLSIEVSFRCHFNREQANDYAPYLAAISTRLPSLESLEFVQHSLGVRSNRLSSEVTQIFLPPWSCFQSIRTLVFRSVETSPHLLGFISSFPNLRALEMNGVQSSLTSPGEQLLHIPPPNMLQNVRLSRCAAEEVLDWLLSYASSSSTKLSTSMLQLGGISDQQITSIAKYLTACGPILQHLSLSFRLSDRDFLSLDFCHNVSLRYLRLEPDLYFEVVSQLLCSIASTALEQIELVMPARGRLARLYLHDEKSWAKADRFLVGQESDNGLSIRVQLHRAIDEETIRAYLPLCTARGLISYVYKPVFYTGTYFSS